MKHDQVVVVTGASGGIGRAVARAYGARGAHVALLARGETGLRAAAEDVERQEARRLSCRPMCPTTARFERPLRRPIRRPSDRCGRNVARTSVFAPFTKIKPEEYKRVTEVTYLGYVYGTMAALELMRAAGGGTIVQAGIVASAYRGSPDGERRPRAA